MSHAETYLQELRRALPFGCRRRVLAEVREHFASAVAAETQRGVGNAEAERLTADRLGAPQALADQVLDDLRTGALGRARRLILVATKTRVAALATVTVVAVAAALVTFAVGSSATPPALQRAAIASALREVGRPYAWGQATPARGFDASGLVSWAYTTAGARHVPHSARELWRLGTPVGRRSLKPGDLVFFDAHQLVGIYLGRGRFLDAEHTGTTVSIRRLDARTSLHYDGAVRLSL